MPFIVSAFVKKMQEKVDHKSSVYNGGWDGGTPTEGDTPAGIPVPGELVAKPPPAPPINWATCWADATELGCMGLIPGPNTMLKAGNAVQKGILLTSNSGTPPHQVLKDSFVAQALTILPGFAPWAVALPPPGQPDFGSLNAMGIGTTTNKPWLNQVGVMLNNWYTNAIMIYHGGPTITWL